jgi:type IV pilus assembly protein PilQ
MPMERSLVGTGVALAALLMWGGFASSTEGAPARPRAAGERAQVFADDVEISTAPATLARETSAPTSLDDRAETKAPETAMEEPAPVEPAGPVGDDAYPTDFEASNNPYARVDSEAAFVPPSIQKTASERAQETGQELLGVLGAEIFHQRVNVVTPPDTDLSEVIRLLAERARLNFIFAEGVIKGRVTLNLKDVALGTALQSLLASHDLALIREGENVFRIVRRKDIQQTAVETKTIYVKVNWVQAESIAATLKNAMGSGAGAQVNQIKAHKESNTVIITDTPPNVALLRDLVSQLDIPQKQVMIEARMVELLINNGRQLGSRTTLERADSSGNSPVVGTVGKNAEHSETINRVEIDENGKPTIVQETVTVPAKAVDTLVSNLLVGGGAPSLSFGTVVSILGKDFDVAGSLDALESRRIANVLANPKVITLDNETALIDIKRDNPYIEAQQGVGQGIVAASVKFKQSGVELLVTPNITNNGYVRMRLQPKQEIYAGAFRNPTTGSDVPIIDKREALTNVIVKDEDTVVIGGLREIDSADNKTQVPWLGQVPIIGWFYKGSSRGFLKNDLMLFVTPHIVKAPVMTATENYKHSRLDAHWDLPDYFFDDSVEIRERRHRGEVDSSARGFAPETLRVPAEGQPDQGK